MSYPLTVLLLSLLFLALAAAFPVDAKFSAPISAVFTSSSSSSSSPNKKKNIRAVAIANELNIIEFSASSGNNNKRRDITALHFATFGNFNSSEVNLVATSPDGKLVGFCQDNSKVTVASLETGRIIGSTRDPDELPVYTVAFSPDSKKIATAGEGETLREYKIDRVQQTLTLFGKVMRGHNSRIRAIAYSNDGKLLVSGGMKGDIRVYDVDDETSDAYQQEKWGSPLAGCHHHERPVRSLVFTENSDVLISTGYDAKICFWDAILLQLKEKKEDPKRMAVTAAAALFVPPQQQQQKHRQSSHVASSGTVVAFGTHDGRVYFYDAESRTQIGDIIVVVGSKPVSSLSFSPSGKILAVATTAMNPNKGIGSVRFYDVETRTEIGNEKFVVVGSSNKGNNGGGGGGDGYRFHGKKHEVYAAVFADTSSSKKITATSGDDGAAATSSPLSMATTLTTASADGTVKLFDISIGGTKKQFDNGAEVVGHQEGDDDDDGKNKNKKKHRRLTLPEGEPIEKVRFSTNGEFVYVTGVKGSEKQFDVESGASIGAASDDYEDL